MRLSIVTFSLALAATASAQLSLGSLTSNISGPCVSALVSLVSGNLTSCLNLPALYPLLTSNGSIIPVLDNWMAGLCAQPACSNATIANVTNTLITGCATDLAQYNITNATLAVVAPQIPQGYLLGRDIVCLKTSSPVNFTNASIPIGSPSLNSTNGTFCVTSVLDQLTGYLGINLTLPYLYRTAMTAATGNYSALLANVSSIPPTALCQGCVFAAADLVFERYPKLLNSTIGNSTLAKLANATCPASNFTLNANGTLPANITEVAFNSTGNTTVLLRRFIDVTAPKRRWAWQL